MAGRMFLGVLACCTATAAHASPRSDPTTGRAVFTGSTLPNATSISLNPAALGLGSATEIYFAVVAVLDQLTIDRRLLDIDTGALTDGTHSTLTELDPGGMAAIVWHPGERGSVGFEVRTPPPESVGDLDPALRYQLLRLHQRNIIATIGGAIRVGRFLFGASVSHDNTLLHLRYARDTALDSGLASDCSGAPCGVENPEASESYDVTVRSPWVSGSNARLNAGFVARVYRNTWLGVGYHTPPGFAIQSALAGRMDVRRAPRDGFEELHGDSVVYVHYPASVDGELRMRMPELALDLHLGARWEDLSRMQAYDVRGFGSTFRSTNVPEWVERPRGFHDSFAAWAGAEQYYTGPRDVWYDRFSFGGRLGFETASLREERTTAMTMSPASLTGDLGAQVTLGGWQVQLSYGAQLFRTVDVTDSAFDPRAQLDCTASGYDYTTAGCEAVRLGYAVPTAAGEYQRFQHALRLGLRYELP
jgi:hypothetical protein